MSLQLGKAIYYILSGNTEVKNYVGNKIFPITTNEGVLAPFIVYERYSIDPEYTKDGPLQDVCSLLVNVIAKEYAECVDISQAVRKALEGKLGVFNGVTILQNQLAGAKEDYGVDGYITQLEFSITSK